MSYISVIFRQYTTDKSITNNHSAMKHVKHPIQNTGSPLRASSYAALHGLTRQRVYRWIHAGRLTSAKQVDGVWFV
jgi:hypothetical protein